jgi:hypothetical protein
MDLLQPNCPFQDRPKHKTTISTFEKLGLDIMSVDEYDLHLDSDHEDEPQNPSFVPLKHLTFVPLEILPCEVFIFGPHFATIPNVHNVDDEKVEVSVPSQKSLTSLKTKNPTTDPIAFTRRIIRASEGLVLQNATTKKAKPKGSQKLPNSKKVKKTTLHMGENDPRLFMYLVIMLKITSCIHVHLLRKGKIWVKYCYPRA